MLFFASCIARSYTSGTNSAGALGSQRYCCERGLSGFCSTYRKNSPPVSRPPCPSKEADVRTMWGEADVAPSGITERRGCAAYCVDAAISCQCNVGTTGNGLLLHRAPHHLLQNQGYMHMVCE